MELALLLVYYVLFLLWLFIVGRLVVEIVRSFARDWRPAGRTAAGLEVLFMVTDPPVKLLRRIIPAVRIGNISLDLSIMILLLVTFILMQVTNNLIDSPLRLA